jgi:hypothetical protein
MDENPYKSPAKFTPVAPDPQPRPKIGRLLPLIGLVLIGSVIGWIGGFVVFEVSDILIKVDLKMREPLSILCTIAGVIVGGLSGFGIREASSRTPRVPKS